MRAKRLFVICGLCLGTLLVGASLGIAAASVPSRLVLLVGTGILFWAMLSLFIWSRDEN